MGSIRRPAVAGFFYPGDAATLRAEIAALLTGADTPSEAIPPKAIIVPHAGYVYSGAVAAQAYATLGPAADRIRRVVLIGPAHRLPVRGLALPSCDAFRTPLGEVPIDRDAVAALTALPQILLRDQPHAQEHALEVQLPFLQCLLGDFRLVPLVAGDASGEQVAEVLETLWGGPETLIVVSSDLSHYHDYDTARRMDTGTAAAIEAKRPEAIGFDQACGRVPIAGLLTVAKRRGLRIDRRDLRNSGDTAGGRDRVVGYGAWTVSEAVPSTKPDVKSDPSAADKKPAAKATRVSAAKPVTKPAAAPRVTVTVHPKPNPDPIRASGAAAASNAAAGPKPAAAANAAPGPSRDAAPHPDRAIIARHGGELLRATASVINYALQHGRPPRLHLDSFPQALRQKRATFVTLRRDGKLRGCIGTVEAVRPLIADAAFNAYRAAFRDPRFAPLQAAERAGLEMTISILSPTAPLQFRNEAELLEQLRPGWDGLVLADGDKHGIFLPQVWADLPDPKLFLARLKQKAGLSEDHWSPTLRASRFTTLSLAPQPRTQRGDAA